MALFQKKDPQQGMFDREMEFNRQKSTFDLDRPEDELVALDRKDRMDDLTRWQQDMQEDIERAVHQLRREYQDENGNWKSMTVIVYDKYGNQIQRGMRAMINNLGINYFITQCNPCMSRNLMMSNYDEDRILVKLRNVVLVFVHHLAYHYKEYNIEVGDMSAIVRLFKDTIEPAHWRCVNNGERSYLNTINKRVEAITLGDTNSNQKKGMLANLFK